MGVRLPHSTPRWPKREAYATKDRSFDCDGPVSVAKLSKITFGARKTPLLGPKIILEPVLGSRSSRSFIAPTVFPVL